jgi:hypothetical protein
MIGFFCPDADKVMMKMMQKEGKRINPNLSTCKTIKIRRKGDGPTSGTEKQKSP